MTPDAAADRIRSAIADSESMSTHSEMLLEGEIVVDRADLEALLSELATARQELASAYEVQGSLRATIDELESRQ